MKWHGANTELSRFEINNIEMLEDGQTPTAAPPQWGLFLEASKFNHSCLPNAHMMFNHHTSQVTILANQDIPKDEEIFVDHKSYNSLRIRQFRRQSLSTSHHFTCMCIACDDSATAPRAIAIYQLGERRRAHMSQLQTVVDQIQRHPGRYDLRENFERLANPFQMIDVALQEGLVYPVVARCFEDMAKNWIAKLDDYRRQGTADCGPQYRAHCRDQGLWALKSALKLLLTITGRDSIATERVLSLMFTIRRKRI